MPILAHLDAALDDPESWAGLFAAANDDELAPIAVVVASYAPAGGGRDRENCAAGAAALATKAHGHPGPLALARWAAIRLGGKPEMPEALGEVDAWILSLMMAAAGRDVTPRHLARDALVAALPTAIPDGNQAEKAALRLALEAACLRRAKRARFHRFARWLGLGAHAYPAPLPDPADIRATEPEAAGPRWRDLMDAAGKVPLDIWEQRLKEARAELGRFNIIVAGRTGVGKTTLIGAVFGKEVGDTLAGPAAHTRAQVVSGRAGRDGYSAGLRHRGAGDRTLPRDAGQSAPRNRRREQVG